jgi:hypothetical protein
LRLLSGRRKAFQAQAARCEREWRPIDALLEVKEHDFVAMFLRDVIDGWSNGISVPQPSG